MILTWWQQILVGTLGSLVVAVVSVITTWRITRSDRDKQNRIIQLDEVKKVVALISQDYEEVRAASTSADGGRLVYSRRLSEIGSAISIAMPNLAVFFDKYCITRRLLLDNWIVGGEESVHQINSLRDDLSSVYGDTVARIHSHARKLIGVREPSSRDLSKKQKAANDWLNHLSGIATKRRSYNKQK